MKKTIVFFCILILSTCGCQKRRIKSTVESIMNSTITLPDSLLCVVSGNCSVKSIQSSERNKLIVYVDSSECSKCHIENIVRYDSLFVQAFSTQIFSIYYILSVPEDSLIDILDFLSLLELPYPVYIDTKVLFLSLNPVIPQDIRYHTLYVDNNGKPLLIGDPVHNPAVCTLFNELISAQ